MLQLVELQGFGDHHPWQLSGGMQMRVAIARALAFEPSLLLMDEPFGALDEMTRERLNIELLEIWRRMGSTVVFVTHSISEAVFLSTRVVVMSPRPGRIAGIVDIDLPQPRTADTREEPRFFELVTEVRELLRGLGADEHGSVARRRPRNDRPSRARRATGSRRSSSSCAAIAAWQLAIELFNIQKFLLPKPWAIVSAFWTQRHLLWSAGWLTLKEALGGFAIGSGLGILAAVVLARFRRVRRR